MRQVIRAQRRRRRLRFWLIFGMIAVVGSAWAGLTKDAVDGGFGDIVQDAPAIEDRPDVAPGAVPLTTLAPTTAVEATTTVRPSSTLAPTTEAP